MTEQTIDETESKSAPNRWDVLLRRYVRVWIWSILLGATTGLSYTYISLRTDKPWGLLIMFPVSVLSLGVLVTIGAWWNLYIHLRIAIIPEFFPSGEANLEDGTRKSQAAYSIRQAFLFTMLAALLRLFYAIAELMLTTVARF